MNEILALLKKISSHSSKRLIIYIVLFRPFLNEHTRLNEQEFMAGARDER